MTMAFSKGFLIFFIAVIFWISGGLCKRGGFLNFQFLCYKNPGHYDSKGEHCDSVPSKNCDPFFIICISNKPITQISQQSCSVLLRETSPYYDQEYVCNTPFDNREGLKKAFVVELPYPIQEVYYVRIDVKDYNTVYRPQAIATFIATFFGNPSSNFQDFKSTVIKMNRAERRVYNSKVSMSISMGLKCDYDLYGDLCVNFCKVYEGSTYTCSNHGLKICNPGWEGKECATVDNCYHTKCAKGATCIVVNQEPKCFCNGIIGPECYPNYDPCKERPCLNGGKCFESDLLDGAINCSCPIPFHGYRCQNKFDLCQIDPCRNNGTCVTTIKGTRICECLPGFTGVLCDYPELYIHPSQMNTTTNMTLNTAGFRGLELNYGIIFGVLFGLSLFIMSIVGIYFLIMSKRGKSNSDDTRNNIHMHELTTPTTHRPSSDYGTYNTEIQYDTIEDRATYVYQITDNDDYLVPSNPKNDTTSPTCVSNSSDYLPMFSNNNLYISDPTTDLNAVKVENEEGPPLPSRTMVRKASKVLTCFK